jgi:hypothetical protein
MSPRYRRVQVSRLAKQSLQKFFAVDSEMFGYISQDRRQRANL